MSMVYNTSLGLENLSLWTRSNKFCTAPWFQCCSSSLDFGELGRSWWSSQRSGGTVRESHPSSWLENQWQKPWDKGSVWDHCIPAAFLAEPLHFKLVKSDFISTRAVFQTALWSFASSNIRDSQLPPSIISIPSPGSNTCERPIKPFNTQNLLLLIFSVCSICCSVCP